MSDTAIDIDGLQKRFGDFRAVDELSFQVTPGEVHGFLGPNGAGKSTTIRVMLGFLRPTAGRIRVHGRNPSTDAAAVTRRTSYVPGDVALWGGLTGQEVLDALAGLRGAYDTAAEARLLEAFSLDPSKRVRAYSKGNRQKVMLVAAFAARTDLLVLDEPTSGLDPLMEQVFQQCVREAADQGRAVLLSSHILAEVEQVCETVTIKDGRLVETGGLQDMRHLAASTVCGRVSADAVAGLRRHLDALATSGLTGRVEDDGQLTLEVPCSTVAPVLGLLAENQAEDIVCTPATLEDLFLRHYEVAAR